MTGCRHAVQFYEELAHLFDAIGAYCAEGLAAGEAVVVLATAVSRDGIEARLGAHGVDLVAARARQQYVALDAAETLARIVVDGRADRRRCGEVVHGLLAPLLADGRHARVRIFAEMVVLLCDDGKHDEAIQLEALWNELAEVHPFSLYCAYPMSSFQRAIYTGPFQRVCDQHTEVIPTESYAALSNPVERNRAVAETQQRAYAVEAEIAERLRLASELREREREDALRQLRLDQLKAEDRQKDEFLAMLSHDLRNPLAPIQLAVGLLRPRTTSAASTYLDIIDRQVSSLTRLVDDLLTISSLRHGKVELHPRRQDVASAVAHALDTTRHLMEQRRHTVLVTQPPRPLDVIADPIRLEQILVNLLVNAAKYTEPEGQVFVTTRTTDATVEISIRDTGIGIDPEVIAHVFDAFRQAEPNLEGAEPGRDHAQGGLGLGLSIAHRLVVLHRGSLEARSAGRGHGAELIVRLPLAPAETAAARPARAPTVRRVRRQLSILVVDDNADTAETLTALLRDQGHEVGTALDGPSALELAHRRRPQVVLLDLGLPSMDGYQVARRLRAAGSDALLIAITGYCQPRDRLRSAEAGFAAHLVKPVQLTTLMTLLDAVAAPPPAPDRPGDSAPASA